MTTIAVVEDDPALLLGLEEKLSREGFRVIATADGEEAIERLGKEPPDLVVLDLMLGGIDGFEVCRWLRKRYPRMPILILSAKGREDDKVEGLRTGADDYMTKPFGLRELLARIHALLRRAGPGGAFSFGKVRVDFEKGCVHVGKEELRLSRIEFELLRFFVRNEGRVLTREEILDGVWGYGEPPAPRTVDFHILVLRRKLEEDPASPRHFLTVPTMGYRFVR